MKFSSMILSCVAVALSFAVAISLVFPPGKARTIICISIGVLVFLFVWLRAIAKKVPDKEDDPWDI
ncbi:hypothetical protein [Paracidovorax avenae]|uniref:hypothetical protein n=1 Tax=Paracidovorax avenae TaxID=80867 RepID=UPI0018645A19|nr:hypothetical protein [Paracidovorax avenae]